MWCWCSLRMDTSGGVTSHQKYVRMAPSNPDQSRLNIL